MSDPITVMIVDDHEMVRKGAKGYLDSQPGITVVAEAESGVEAVQLAREHVPDVVLMDLVMPEMNGSEAIRQILKHNERIKIIALTSFDDQDLVEHLLVFLAQRLANQVVDLVVFVEHLQPSRLSRSWLRV